MKPARNMSWSVLVAGMVLLPAGPLLAQTAPRPDPATAFAPLVAVHLVGQDEELLEIPGTVQAAARSDLAFQVPGLLIERPVVAGQRIKAGQLLARLDPLDYENRVVLEQARLNLARADFERFSRLAESPASPVAPAEVDRMRSMFEIAQVRVSQAQKDLQDTTLRAPFDGVVAVLLVDNHVQVQARQPILLMDSADELEVTIDLPERVLSRVRAAARDRPVGEAEFAVLPGRRFPVMLAEIATRADSATQTFRVTLTLDRPRDANILPGMTATVYARPEITTHEELRIPTAAAFTNEAGQTSVWVVDPETYRIAPRPVRLQEDGTRMAAVLEGLRPGERVVGAGADRLEAGMVIRPFRSGMLSE